MYKTLVNLHYLFCYQYSAGLKFSGDDLSSTDRKVEAYHKIIEAIKLAYADRYQLGDPSYENSTVEVGICNQ